MPKLPEGDTLILPELVQYLRLPPHIIDDLAQRQVLPGEHAGGRWRFRRSEVDRWLDLGMPGWSSDDLRVVAGALSGHGPSLASALLPSNVRLDVPARDGRDCFDAVVASLPLPSDVDRSVVLQQLLRREALCSTALDHGVAIPHTPRTGPRVVPVNLVAFVRTLPPIDFGAADGERTDLFFFVFAVDQHAHLGLLSRVVTVAQFPRMTRLLRTTGTPEEVVAELRRTEQWLFGVEEEG